MIRLFARKELYSLTMVVVAALLIAGVSVSRIRAQVPPAHDPAAAARALRDSLTADQRLAIRAVLSAHEQEVAALAQKMAAAFPSSADLKARLFLPVIAAQGVLSSTVTVSTAPTSTPATNDFIRTAPSAALSSITSDLEHVRAAIEADLARVLTPEQLTLFNAALATAPAAELDQVAAAQASDVNAVGCFNSAQWVSYALAYNQAAKAFAFMAAFNVDFGTETPAAVQAYISFNEADSYAVSGLEDLSTASVLLTAADPLVQNINGGTLFGVKGNAATQVAKARIELAVSNALLDYAASGGVVNGNVGIGGNYFSYFAYAYGNIADFFVSEGLARSVNCF